MAIRPRAPICFLPLNALIASCTDGTGTDGMGVKDWVSQRVVMNDAVIDSRDPYDVIDLLSWTGEIYGSVADYEASLKGSSREQRLVFAVIWYISDVNTGGHHQFFWNSTGVVWPDAVSAFREVGLTDVAEILEEKARRLGGPPSRDREDRRRQADLIQQHRAKSCFDGPVREPKMTGQAPCDPQRRP